MVSRGKGPKGRATASGTRSQECGDFSRNLRMRRCSSTLSRDTVAAAEDDWIASDACSVQSGRAGRKQASKRAKPPLDEPARSPMSPQSYSNVLQMIGHTPLVAVNHLDTGPCRLFLKLESQNPGGSIKDRVGLYLIEAAEREGRLPPGGTLIEATAGNTGLGLALVAAQKGYRLLLVIPDKMSQEKIFHLKAMGAEVVLTRSDVSKGHPEYYRDLAERLASETPNSFYVEPVRQSRQSPRARGDHRARDLGADGSQPRRRRLRCRDGWHRHWSIALSCARRAGRRDRVGRSGWIGARRVCEDRQDAAGARHLAGRGHRRRLRAAGRGPRARQVSLYHLRRGGVQDVP